MNALAAIEELDEDQIATLQRYARDNGGIEYAYATMGRLRERAAEISATLPDPAKADPLMQIFDYIIARDY